MCTTQREFTLLLLPSVARKLKRIVPSLLSHPSLLAHTIYQSLAFDAALVEQGFELARTSASRAITKAEAGANGAEIKWEGISETVLGKKEWFEAWMEGERKCE